MSKGLIQGNRNQPTRSKRRKLIPTSQPLEVALNLLGHQHPALLEKSFVVLGAHVEDAVRNAASLQVRGELLAASDVAEIRLAGVDGVTRGGEVLTGTLLADGDVDATLEVRVVRDLVVEPLWGVELLLEVCLGEDVVNVPDVSDDVRYLEPMGEQRVVGLPRLGGQENHPRTGPGRRGDEVLGKLDLPERIGEP